MKVDMVEDEDRVEIEEYGVWVEKRMYGRKYMGVERKKFMIGEDGRIDKVWKKVKVDGKEKEVIEEERRI